MLKRHWASGWTLRFGGLAAIWGLSFLFIKIADRTLAPVQVALGRMLTGTLALLAVLAVRRVGLPRRPGTWAHLAVAGALLNAVPFSLIALGERHVSSVTAGIWNATTPLWALPVAVMMIPEERLTRGRLAGLGLGFAGALTVTGVWRGHGTGSLGGNLVCMAAAACYGIGFPYTRRFLSHRSEGPLSLAAGQLVCGTLWLIVPAAVMEGLPGRVPLGVAASVCVLGALGTGIAYILNYSIVRDAGATTASTVTYLIPIFSTLAGILLLGERVSWNQPAGAAVILLGAAAAQGRLAGRRPSRVPIAPETAS